MQDGEKKPKTSPINGQPVPSNPNGRPKGVPNKATTRFKEALNELFEKSAEDMTKWLAEIERPEDRFAVLAKFVDLLYPKLARQEVTGKDGTPLQISWPLPKTPLDE